VRIDRNTRLFFDASCLVAATRSPNGGSGFLLSVCRNGFLRGIVSQPVVLEAERNILQAFGEELLLSFDRVMDFTPLAVLPAPSQPALARLRQTINEKDVHVVAAAIQGKAEFLVTLDKPLAS
jgi:predicted nucleic acid-binding protein